MGKIITVASGKGGTGKTTTVAAVSSCLAALGHKTLCVDFDVGLRNLDFSLGMADFAVADFMDVIGGKQELQNVCHESPLIGNLFFLSAPLHFSGIDPDESAIEDMYREIRSEFDYCFIDSPAGIGRYFRFAHAGADMAIIVTIGELPSITGAQKTATEIRDMGVEELRLLVNRVVSKKYYRLQTTIDDIIDTVGARLIGVVREDESVALSLHNGTPLILYKRRLAAYDFLDVARRLTGEDVPLRPLKP